MMPFSSFFSFLNSYIATGIGHVPTSGSLDHSPDSKSGSSPGPNLPHLVDLVQIDLPLGNSLQTRLFLMFPLNSVPRPLPGIRIAD